MSNTDIKISKEVIKALDNLASDKDLIGFEKKLSGINFFEIVGMERSEIRHSTFLAWLLNPYAEHGLSDFFLRRLLQKLDFSNQKISSFEIATFDLTDAICETEKYDASTKGRIDIFIQSQSANLAIFIENKVDSSEGKGQLEKYKTASSSLTKENIKALFVYLTKDGDTPSDSDYMALSYKNISEIINDCLDLKADSLSDEAEMMLKHYDKMLKRNIIPDENFLQDIRAFYKKHKIALDKIEQFRTDKLFVFMNTIKTKLKECIAENKYVDIPYSSMLRFITNELQDEKIYKLGGGWGKLKPEMPFLFECDVNQYRTKVLFCIGNIDKNKKQEIFNVLEQNDALKKILEEEKIKFSTHKFDRDYVHIARKTLMRYNVETHDIDDVLNKIEHSFNDYKPVITKITNLLAKNFIGG